ncbi:hypothetical protein [Cryptosporangium phraense]|uniref:Uncharacterized protein n=1 Tax=Cryptosporangium phraense TaxID=2593070 RepID=A0A545AJG2_9ACTN|nr:hypothetical protein [Cryptosporangium phraense]TQS41448.1 hypothetical protein FL583_29545 [Cryptosporangium phraense]
MAFAVTVVGAAAGFGVVLAGPAPLGWEAWGRLPAPFAPLAGLGVGLGVGFGVAEASGLAGCLGAAGFVDVGAGAAGVVAAPLRLVSRGGVPELPTVALPTVALPTAADARAEALEF